MHLAIGRLCEVPERELFPGPFARASSDETLTPSRRTPEWTSVPDNSASAVFTSSAEEATGRRSECDRVIVVKSPYRSFTVTVRP